MISVLRFALVSRLGAWILLCCAVILSSVARAGMPAQHSVSIGGVGPTVDLGLSDDDKGVWIAPGLYGFQELYLPSGLGVDARASVGWDVLEQRLVTFGQASIGWYSHRLRSTDYGIMTGSHTTYGYNSSVTHQWGERVGTTHAPRIIGAYVAPRLTVCSDGLSWMGGVVAFRTVAVRGETWAPDGRPEWGRTRRVTVTRFDLGPYVEGGGGGLFFDFGLTTRHFMLSVSLSLGLPMRMQFPMGVAWVNAPDLVNVPL